MVSSILMIRTLKLSLWLPIGVVVLSVIRFGFDPSFSTGFVPMLFSLPAMVFGLVFAWPGGIRFPGWLHTRARPYFVHSRWAPPPSAVCSDRPVSGSTPGSSRSRHGWCCGSCGGAPAVWRRWAAASKARQGFRDIGPDPCNNALLVELRPILHIHLHPQTSKSLHLRFDFGRTDHPERVK